MGVLATLALFAWMALMMLFLLGKFQPGVRVAAAEPVKGGKESVEEWTKRYLAWRAQRKRQLIKTSILLDPETDLEDVSPPLNEHQSLHRAVVLEAAIWGYVKSLTLVDHVMACDTKGGKMLRDRCLENEWVYDSDAKKPDPPPQTTNGIEQMDQVVIKTGGTPQVVLGPAEVVIKHSTVKKVLDQMRMPELAPGMHPDDCTCFGCFREPLDDAIRNNG